MKLRAVMARGSLIFVAAAFVTGCGGPIAGTPSAVVPSALPATIAPTVVRTPLPASTPPVAGARHVPARYVEMDPGTYFLFGGLWTPVTFTFDITGEGWIAENAGQTVSMGWDPNAPDEEISWSVAIVEELFAEPCGGDDRLPVGPTVEAFVTALQSLPGPQVSEATDVTIGGYPGKVVEVEVPTTLDIGTCDPPGLGLQLWLDKPGGKYLVAQTTSVARIYLVDVAGERFILTVNIGNEADPERVAEFEAIVASIQYWP
jgi:hypothetical protein